MATYGTADLRNVALVGPPHAGKTTLLEAMLHDAGALQRRGSVADGSSFVDFDPLEKETRHSLFLKVFNCAVKKRQLNLLDSPGYPDFFAEAIAALNAVETAAVCISAGEGVTFLARRGWKEAEAVGRGRILVVTKADADNLDLEALVAGIQEALGQNCVPVNLPVALGPGVSGVVPVLGGGEPPAELKEFHATCRERLVESLVSLDDAVMEKYLETAEVAPEMLAALLTKGIVERTFTPVLFTSAQKSVGMKELLEFIAQSCPSPEAGPYFRASAGTELTAELVAIDPRERGDFAAKVFKTFADPYVGRLSYLRVVAGQIKTDELFLNPRVGKHEKMGGLQRPNGKEHAKIDSACAGDIVCLSRAETVETNDSLAAEKAPVVFPHLALPNSMVALAVTPKNRNDEQKLSLSLRKVCSEDPSLVMDRDRQTGELVLHGFSALHLETQLKRLTQHYKIEVQTKIPKVPMRETVVGASEGHYRHKKQSGGRGQFGEVYLRVRPRERGAGFEFKDATFGGSIPRQFLPAVEKGIIDQMEKGVVAGFPVVDLEAEVYDGKYHDVDSDEASFKIAGARAFRDAFEKAKPVLLEPVVNLEVAVPSRFMGDINSDLNSRRGRITGMDAMGDIQVIRAQVPLKEVQTYGPNLRSLTQGEGSFTFEISHYDLVPHNVAEEVIAAHKAGLKPEED